MQLDQLARPDTKPTSSHRRYSDRLRAAADRTAAQLREEQESLEAELQRLRRKAAR